ncbi:hypothetical protein PT277_05400 [Acetobacteraceae bacterium ESL0709]|nr:hypothetical protein [Acetobacteraceae bacterium ESL0697]MDF7678132.1 hypothetical protein [Acetobacteraceae bacterium ESL0709]
MKRHNKGKSRGRPTKYTDDTPDQAYKLCLLGATDKELADFFDISVQTLNNWKKNKIEFAMALRKGKEIADSEIADRLYQRALGFSCKAVKVFNDKGTPLIVNYTEHYPPDMNAIIFWLRSRQPQKWRDKPLKEADIVSKERFKGIRRTIIAPSRSLLRCKRQDEKTNSERLSPQLAYSVEQKNVAP